MFLPKFRAVRAFLLSSCLMASVMVWALPTPSQINAAVQAGQLTQAESMLREVVAEKPQSAKAHYELGVVLERQARYAESETELKQAQSLEPSLKFTRDPQGFEQQLTHVSAMAHQPHTTSTMVPVDHAPMPSAHVSSGPSALTLVWLLIALVVVVALFLRNRVPNPTVVEVPVRPQGFGANFSPTNPSAYPPNAAPGYGPAYPASTAGSGMAGAVVGGVAGLAAGYALAKAMEGDHPSGVSNMTGNTNAGYIPSDNAAPYNPDANASFEPSAGDSWDNDSTNMGGDSSDGDAW